MKEVFGKITLFNADCMDVMREMPDKAFDLAIVDPPYGLGIDGQKKTQNKNPKHNRKFYQKKNWDTKITPPEFFEELRRVSVDQIIWGANYFVRNLNYGTKGWIVWDKGQHGLTMSDCELAFSSFNKPTRVIVINRGELTKEKTIHPTQKPIRLYKWLLENYAKKGYKILDTHLGSGSLAIACDEMDFQMTGIEIDPDYYAGARQRLINHRLQQRLF